MQKEKHVVGEKVQPWEAHGRLVAGDRFLTYEDGTPFFYLGDTNWDFLVRATRSDVRTLMDNREEKGFTVMQTVITGIFIKQEGEDSTGLLRSNAYGDLPFIDGDVTRPATTEGSDPLDSIQYDYWDHVDYIVEEADNRGIYMGLLLCWHVLYDLGVVTKENANAYGRWIANRYKDHPNIIWIIGGDTRGHVGDGEEMFDQMARGIKAVDTNHLMTFHPRGGSGSSQWFHDREWLDFNMIQSGHGKRDNPNYIPITRDYNFTPPKPCMDGEPRYEDHSVNWNPDNGWFTDFDVRQAAYWSLFAGAHGHTYGTRGVWQMYSPLYEKRGPLNYYWYDAMNLPGAWDMKHARDLMLSRPFLGRIPDQSLVLDPLDTTDHIRATRGDGYAFIYSPTGSNFEADLSSVGPTVNLWWYNPRLGMCYSEENLLTHRVFAAEVSTDNPIRFDPPGSPERGNDWILVVDESNTDFPIPGWELDSE